MENKPDLVALREEHKQVAHLLTGEVAQEPTPYHFGDRTVVSWELLQGEDKNPTLGRIPPGTFEFNTGVYTERITVLEGVLAARVDDKRMEFLGLYEQISTEIGSNLVLSVRRNPLLYLCEYSAEGF